MLQFILQSFLVGYIREVFQLVMQLPDLQSGYKVRSYVRLGVLVGVFVGFLFYLSLLNGAKIGLFELSLYFLWCMYVWGGNLS